MERLGPRKRAKMLAGSASSRMWKKCRRRAGKVAETVGMVVDSAAAAVALPTLSPLSNEAAHVLALGSSQGPPDWTPATYPAISQTQESFASKPVGSALTRFLELDVPTSLNLPPSSIDSFFTSPQHFPASQALRMEDLYPQASSPTEDRRPSNHAAEDSGPDVFGDAKRLVLPVLGLAAATVVGGLFTRRTVFPRPFPRLAMRALAYPALFVQTGIMASEGGAERARQVRQMLFNAFSEGLCYEH